MSFKDRWKQFREGRQNLYDKEEDRLRLMIAELDPFDEKYDQLQAKLKNNISMRESSKESKRKICKSDRGGILMRILQIGGALAGGIMIGKFEKDGLTYTGEKRSFMDAVTRTFGNLFMKG